MRSVKIPGGEFEVKIKAKGFCTRQVNITYTKDEKGQQHRHVSYDDHEYVNKIMYKVKMNGQTIRFVLVEHDRREKVGVGLRRFPSGASKADGFQTTRTKSKRKPGIDPGFALLFAHICITEFAPDEIKKDLHPNWSLCPGYVHP